MNKSRLLKAEEISCRVQSVTDSNGAIILLYKDARVDMDLLDATYGPTNWQRTHEIINGNLFCTISIWDDDKKCWVSKQDVGVESKTEATKGEASDAFKRAGFNWGVGRELYTAPFIFVQLQPSEVYTNKSGKPAARSSFGLSVKEIGYNEAREITRLVLVDKRNTVRYTLGQKAELDEEEQAPDRDARIDSLCKHHGVTKDTFIHFANELAKEGKIAKKAVDRMSDNEFSVMLSLVHNALEATTTKDPA